ncbi:hypothetical protein AWH48_20005 [Domibacillus aminovorans]|uniref:Uncharacterized protein n=1 Tax=Domibacillus aminovorans TaxID=29332 RepID=A0A177KTK8_9BACI|nr:hypothetical protein [Domibacillus aminovorans]OAH56650.1 hypothetical protein AWH48_20005 [Domibacillus aminovorans]
MIHQYNSWKLLYFDEIENLFSDRYGINLTSSTPNPFYTRSNEFAYAHIFGNPLMALEQIKYEVNSAGRDVKSPEDLISIPPNYIKNTFMLYNDHPLFRKRTRWD